MPGEGPILESNFDLSNEGARGRSWRLENGKLEPEESVLRPGRWPLVPPSGLAEPHEVAVRNSDNGAFQSLTPFEPLASVSTSMPAPQSTNVEQVAVILLRWAIRSMNRR
jgi:hypothetical protein